MNKVISLFLVLFLFSCGSSKRVVTTKESSKQNNTTSEGVQSNTEVETLEKVEEKLEEIGKTEDYDPNDKVAVYIEKYKLVALMEMKRSGVPASITLAQGILESGAGQGDLTKRANNHFGIKCHNWSGEKVYHDDDKKGECFRKYDNPNQSFKDHSDFLTSRGRYAFLFDLKLTDYRGWAKGLRKAGYATDPKYPSKLISLIERYGLNKYDNLSASLNDTEEVKEIKKGEHKISVHIVKKGETLYSISRAYEVSVEDIMKWNEMEGSFIEIGQKLNIKK